MEKNEASQQPETTIIKAQAFQLVDVNGIERGSLALDHNSNPFLALCDPQGNKRLVMRVGTDGTPDINLLDHNQDLRMAFRLDKDWTPDLAFFDSDGSPQVVLTMHPSGKPRLWLYESGCDDPRIGLLIDSRGQATLEVWGRDIDAGVMLFVDADAGPVWASLTRTDRHPESG